MCYTKAVLQQVLDNAYEGDIDEIMEHLESCPTCRRSFQQLKEADDLILDALQKGMTPPPVRAFNPNQSIDHVKGQERRIIKMNKKRRKWSAVAAALVICIGLLALQPVRVAASEFLKLFRLQDVKAVSISESDIREIESVFQKGNGSVDIKNMISFDVNTANEEITIEKPEPSAIKAKYPNAKLMTLPENFSYNYATVQPQADVTLKLDVNKVNDFLKYIGEKTLLPEQLDQKPFVIHSSNILNYSVNQQVDDSQNYFSVTQMDMPTFEVPGDINVNELAGIVLSMDIMPQSLKQQLASFGDITATLPFPYDEQREIKENIKIKGQDAILVHAKDTNNQYFRMCFKEDNTLYLVEGNYPADKIQSILETLE